jgi:hypothetical protein
VSGDYLNMEPFSSSTKHSRLSTARRSSDGEGHKCGDAHVFASVHSVNPGNGGARLKE